MLALLYLALMFWIGDAICRRFYHFVSLPHRLAAAFLVGMLTSSWFTYLTARIFVRTARPLLWGDALFFAATIGAFVWVTWKEKSAWWPTLASKLATEAVTPSATVQTEAVLAPPGKWFTASANQSVTGKAEKASTLRVTEDTTSAVPAVSTTTVNTDAPDGLAPDGSFPSANADGASALPADQTTAASGSIYLPRPPGSDKLDWVFIAAYFILAAWLMFATLNSSGGKLHTSVLVLSDFAQNVSLTQSFAFGKNFPTQYPFFAGEKIRYHFLFWFQTGNLEFLGLDPALSINLLSIFSMVALLILTMVLGEVLFNSRAVGYIASALFFFFGSLSYVPFLRKQESLGSALQAITKLDHFLPSIWPQYRGETWGNYTQTIFVNQRHIAGAIAILLLVLIFLVLRYRDVPIKGIHWRALKGSRGREAAADQKPAPADVVPAQPPQPFWLTAPGFIFSGVLLGLLPMWNSAVFVAGFAILLFLFILLPFRKQMLALAVTAGIIALPQVIYLTRGGYGDQSLFAVWHWGYLFSPGGCKFCFGNPTIWFVIKYLGFTVGLKWLPVALALVFATRLQRRFFVAGLSLVLMTFLFQLSASIVDNHKYLHVWIIIINLFAAYGLYRLWRMKTLRIAGRIAAIILTVAIVTGGAIDLFPIHNVNAAEADFQNEPLIDWVRTNTKGDAIFLSDRYFWHPILLAGRRIFFGYQFITWAAGYDLGKREPIYKQMFESHDPAEVFRLLKENGIDYVAYDDAIRRGDYIKKPNEQVYAKNFQKVWVDEANHYGKLIIYKVPDVAPQIGAPEHEKSPAPAVNMFTGGRGTGPGQFDNPKGLAIDRAGNILVSDMSNARIEKFSPKGDFISSFGQRGWAEGELVDPFGIAIDRDGNIYVVEAGSGRIQKFKPDGTSSAIWKRTVDELDMYGPRKIALGPDDSLYVVDMGHVRIIKFNLEGRQTAHWGTPGEGDGQFRDMTSVAVDPKENKVYVADSGNKRIQIFDPNGNFLGKWQVDEWGTFFGFEDLAIDAQARRLYASSATMDNILVFDLTDGTRLPPLQPKPPDKLEGPTAIALSKGKLYVLNNKTARVSVIDLVETKK